MGSKGGVEVKCLPSEIAVPGLIPGDGSFLRTFQSQHQSFVPPPIFFFFISLPLRKVAQMDLLSLSVETIIRK